MNNNQNIGMGFAGFHWFQGVVEDRIDPLKLGRVRVRVLGIHTDDKSKIPTEHLPWAYPLQPITSAAMNGMGNTPIGPVEGTWVFGFFRDGDSCQEPVIIGTVAGTPQEYPYPKSKKIGFLDPREDLTDRPRKFKKKEYPNDGNGAVLETEEPTPPTGESYPRNSHPYGIIVGENDVNRLARNEKIDETIVKLKRDERDLEIPTANEGETWDEPETPYDAEYPYNHVYESESGHIIEIDDTPGNERLHTYHKSGTFEEIYADGIKVEKIAGNHYKIVMEETYAHHQNRVNITIDGPFNLLVRNSTKVVVMGDCDMEVGGDYTLSVGGNCKIESKGSMTVKGSSTTVGAELGISLNASSVSSNPPVNKAYQAGVAGGITPFFPSIPIPTGADENPASDTVSRTYPREIPNYPIQDHP